MNLPRTAPARCGLSLLLALAASSAPAQQTATENRLNTQGACSPGIINNAGLITINCGANNVELLKMLNELLTSNTRQELLPALQKMRGELAELSRLAPRREAFGEALARGELKAVKRLLSQGVTPYEEYQGRYALEGFFANTSHLRNSAEVFKLLLRHGLDVDRELDPRLSSGKKMLAEYVLETECVDLFRLLWASSQNKAAIRELLLSRFISAQAAQERAHAGTPRTNKDREQALLTMWLIAEPDEPFELSLREVRAGMGITGLVSPGTSYDGPDGCFLFLKTTSLLRRVTYQIAGQRLTADWTTRLPINRGELLRPETPIIIEATDAIGRQLGPLTITVDFEEVRC